MHAPKQTHTNTYKCKNRQRGHTHICKHISEKSSQLSLSHTYTHKNIFTAARQVFGLSTRGLITSVPVTVAATTAKRTRSMHASLGESMCIKMTCSDHHMLKKSNLELNPCMLVWVGFYMVYMFGFLFGCTSICLDCY